FAIRPVRVPEGDFTGLREFARYREFGPKRSPTKHAAELASPDADATGAGAAEQCSSVFRPELREAAVSIPQCSGALQSAKRAASEPDQFCAHRPTVSRWQDIPVH